MMIHRFGRAATIALIAVLFFAGLAACALPSVKDMAAGSMFRECDYCPQMVVIPAGQLTMGSPEGEAERDGAPDGAGDAEQPRRRVDILKPFALSRTEVTRRQFAKFVEETGYGPSGDCHALNTMQQAAPPTWAAPGFPQSDTDPVVCVNWKDARAYTAWLSAQLGKAYRLPTEAEWEHVARGGTEGARPWTGLTDESACHFANVADASAASALGWRASNSLIFQCDDNYPYTAPVASFEPNEFGVVDMLGNVWEWVEDCFHDSYVGAPIDQRAWIDPECAVRADRGGSWNDVKWIVRSAHRGREDPAVATTNLGIRVARDLQY